MLMPTTNDNDPLVITLEPEDNLSNRQLHHIEERMDTLESPLPWWFDPDINFINPDERPALIIKYYVF